MTTKKRYAFLIGAFFVFASTFQLHAQFGAGFAVSSYGVMDYYPGPPVNKTIAAWGGSSSQYYPQGGFAFRANGCYQINRRMRLNLAIDYFFQADKLTQASDSSGPAAHPIDYFYANDPQLALRVDFEYSLKNDLSGSPFGIYALAGVAANTIFYDVRYTRKQMPFTDSSSFVGEQRQTYNGTSFNLGIGFEVPLHNHYAAYLELRACSGTNSYVTADDFNHARYLPHNFNPAYAMATIGIRKDFKRKGVPTKTVEL